MYKKTEIENLLDRFPDAEIPNLDFLIELALDLSWYWNHAADEIWETLDNSLWEQTHNPWIVLQTVSLDRITVFLNEPSTQQKIAELKKSNALFNSVKWFQEKYVNAITGGVAYFCMEFMLSEGLPIYSGGLGNVAGDQLKGASDMGIPVIGVGLLYQQGYFRQVIGPDGSQEELYPYNDPSQLPILPLRRENGEWLRLKIEFPGYSLWLRTWEVKVGNVRLYLLDSNDAGNYPAYRGITSELYGGGTRLRLQQEIVLGIGGWRLLKELNIEPDVCHLNEGHAAFTILERARQLMLRTGQSFEEALAVTRAGNLFTTHTAVAAGFDIFQPHLVKEYLGEYAYSELKISVRELLALGRINSWDDAEPFNMAYLSFRGAGAVNGVSRLHGKVSRKLFQSLFPRWPEEEVPVGHVTNGVHVRSWDAEAAVKLWHTACGMECWLRTAETITEQIRIVSDEQLWEMRNANRKTFINYIRKRLPNDMAASGASPNQIEEARHIFDPNTLTIGFARRFATYKRPTLLLRNKDRLIRILTDPTRPVQIVIAGKAHPADEAGQTLITEWVNFSKRPEVKSKVIFLSDYDMLLTGHMVQGVDVWLNNPRRPWEASGTSGMKVLVNGGINISELDGWWDEAYSPELGWALGDRREHGENVQWDDIEADQLYSILENEVVPEFYSLNEKGMPESWIAKMRNSMAALTPQYSTNRSMKEYAEQYYLPAAEAYKKRLGTFGKPGSEIIRRKRALRENWGNIRFGKLKIDHTETGYHFRIPILLDGVNPDEILVELYADGIDGAEPLRIKMNAAKNDESNTRGYDVEILSTRPPEHFTVRIIPYDEEIVVPLENNLILWQK